MKSRIRVAKTHVDLIEISLDSFGLTLLVSSGVLNHIGFLPPIGALEVTPEAVFFVFLPTLIFQSAFHLDARALRENLAAAAPHSFWWRAGSCA